VKPGDSLSVISEKTGVGVETLQRLNPEIDPQVLRSGERVRLR
jgi:LysM repeat protein